MNNLKENCRKQNGSASHASEISKPDTSYKGTLNDSGVVVVSPLGVVALRDVGKATGLDESWLSEVNREWKKPQR